VKNYQTTEFILFFFIQFFLYFLLTCNFRAVAKGHYILTVITDIIISAVQFFLIKRIAESGTMFAFAGMVSGGGLGSVTGIYIN
jgi:hypothetical protein